MEDWIGYLIFIGIALFSMAARGKKSPSARPVAEEQELPEEEEAAPSPNWPGPVMGGPFGYPGSGYPRPVQPVQGNLKVRPIVSERPPEAASGEGVSMQGMSAGEPFRRASFGREVQPTVGKAEPVPTVDFRAAMADRSTLAQAFVMAEVLDKPLALRRRRRR